jgi:hypothetical protein
MAGFEVITEVDESPPARLLHHEASLVCDPAISAGPA